MFSIKSLFCLCSGRVCCQQCGRRVKATTLQRLYFNIIQTDSLALSNDTFLNVYKKKIELEHLIEIQRKRIEDQRSKIQGLGTELFSAKFNLERCWAKEKELNDEFRKISVFFGIICFLVGCFAYIIGSFVFGMLSSGNQNPQPRKGFFF